MGTLTGEIFAENYAHGQKLSLTSIIDERLVCEEQKNNYVRILC